MTVLQVAALAAVAISGGAVVLAPDPLRQALVLVIGMTGLPDFGHYHGVYGRVIDGIGVSVRHATDLVTALNFDIRGFDTLGEEFILFASVLGVVLILREMRGEHPAPHQEEADEHTFAGASESLRALALAL